MLVLEAIAGPDESDVAVHVPAIRWTFDVVRGREGVAGGVFSGVDEEAPATDVDRAALETVKKLGMEVVAVTLPDWPYDSLNIILFAESRRRLRR